MDGEARLEEGFARRMWGVEEAAMRKGNEMGAGVVDLRGQRKESRHRRRAKDVDKSGENDCSKLTSDREGPPL